VPSANNFPGKTISKDNQAGQNDGNASFRRSQSAEVTYAEGIYIGYRYYTTFKVPVSYEFGFGLSYATFAYSGLKLSSASFGKNMTVSVDVKNSGKAAGKEVVELYLSSPDQKADKPACELKGFAKTKLLQPGEMQTISFTLDPGILASFNPATSTWLAEAGKYTVKIGASVNDIRAEGTFTLPADKVTGKVSKALIPATPIETMKR
jgi:beta-glucosidase